ncbi:hypothetical protein E2L07_01905 [Halalkalibacterium halodurans]|uniref:dynamin family protein n=1 Tax=Halalkalibacterium halodurans TaxID=86665 RepID=UPI0010672D27|nr:hypothetical protein E2L07_01905 [Halalkalibacterium halodurans]
MQMTTSQQTRSDVLTFTSDEQKRRALIEEKQASHRYDLAFCGHYSAGKSTILNRLIGAEVLPTSPIPTSANIIKIAQGPLGLKVEKNNGELSTFTGEIPWDQVREWGMNGEEISSLTLTLPLPFLNETSCIFDTPGVDSTDPTHQAVTTEQLYTTDGIVYVMDYNHVQSETNLYFLKQLSDEKKPIVIVINQIDKHDEQEVPFATFDQSVKDVFKKWGIEFETIYYTSMKVANHPLNQFSTFAEDVKKRLYYSDSLIPFAKQRLWQSFYYGIERRLRDELEQTIEAIHEEMSANGYDPAVLTEKTKLEAEREKVLQLPQTLLAKGEQEVSKLFQNVTLFPFTTTDLTRDWLESVQPSYKVGLLFSKKKTEAERASRLQKAVADLQDKVKSQLEFHLHRLFQEQIDWERLTNKEEVERAISEVHFKVTPTLFIDHVKIGTTSREYVFTFTSQLTDLICKQLKAKALVVFQKQQEGIKAHVHEQLEQLEEKLSTLQNVKSYVDKIEEAERSFQKQKQHLMEEAERYDDQGQYAKALAVVKNQSNESIMKEATAFYGIRLPNKSVIADALEEPIKGQDVVFREDETKEWIDRLYQAIEKYDTDGHPLHHEMKKLLERMERYHQQQYVVSLFGAFSAGKSSFANALLGEAVLPVSPNPTTATVTTVCRPTDQYAHRSAIIKMKNRADLDEEIQAVADQLDLKLSLKNIQSWKPKRMQVATNQQRSYVNYLSTLQASLKDQEWTLGSEQVIDLEELALWVGTESHACLIQEVTLYYDCDLTRAGVVLVDTPGVNSIHGRHTNVAFTQLKESDAIFYLTYYNHSFSKADQYFLQQMAKINEAFHDDKLYFVINAADLAASAEELAGVVSHVKQQLKANHMESPRLFYVSSKQALAAKTTGETSNEDASSFHQFETMFYQQMINQLKRISAQRIVEEAALFCAKLGDTLAFLQKEEGERKTRRQEVQQIVEMLRDELLTLVPTQSLRESEQEVAELFLYLRQRLRYVLADEFSQFVNVTTVTGASRKQQKAALTSAIQAWKREGEQYVRQELAATTVRLETVIQGRMTKWQEQIIYDWKRSLPHLTVDAYEQEVKVIVDSDVKLLLEVTSYEAFYPSARSFFEEGGLKRLKETLVDDMLEVATKQLKEAEWEYSNAIVQAVHQASEDVKKQLDDGLNREITRIDSLMSSEIKREITEQRDQLQTLIDESVHL